jgi:hypothetical protein
MSRLFTGGRLQTAFSTTDEPFTIAAWAKRSITDGAGELLVTIAADIDQNNNRHSLGISPGENVGAASRSTSTAEAVSPGAITDADTWHHLAGVWTGNALRRAFLDGTGGANNTTARTITGTALVMGVSPDGFSAPFSGRLAHVAVWFSALSEGDLALLAAGANPLEVSPGTLVEYWPLDDASLTGVVAGRVLDPVGVTTAFDADNPTVDPPPSDGVEGTVSRTLDDSTGASSGSVDVGGSASSSLDSAAADSSGDVPVTGGSSRALADVALDAAGSTLEPPTEGTVSRTLDDAAVAASGSVSVGGSAASTLDDASASASGSVSTTGQAQATLDDAELDSSGVIGDAPVLGSASVTLDDAAGSASGTVHAGGSAQVSLDDAAGSAEGDVATSGSASGSLDDAGGESQGSVSTSGHGTIALDDAQASAGGDVSVHGTVARALDDATLTAGNPNVRGVVVTLPARRAHTVSLLGRPVTRISLQARQG